MYSAEQIRNKAYIPDKSKTFVDINLMIIIADSQGKNSIKIRQSDDGWDQYLKAKGYTVEPVEFLGTKFWQISW